MTRLALMVLCVSLTACVAKDDGPASSESNHAGALVIAYSADSADTFTASRIDSVIAFDWLREVTTTHHLELESKTFAFGTLVERIGHRKNGEGGYWLYKVNGQMIPKSSDAHRVAWSDTVTFFFDER